MVSVTHSRYYLKTRNYYIVSFTYFIIYIISTAYQQLCQSLLFYTSSCFSIWQSSVCVQVCACDSAILLSTHLCQSQAQEPSPVLPGLDHGSLHVCEACPIPQRLYKEVTVYECVCVTPQPSSASGSRTQSGAPRSCSCVCLCEACPIPQCL